MAEKLLTIREVAYTLGVSEKEVIELTERGEIPAYKVGGVYLRFQKNQIEQYKTKHETSRARPKVSYTFGQRLSDFFYFYDFYIFCAIAIMVLLVIIGRG